MPSHAAPEPHGAARNVAHGPGKRQGFPALLGQPSDSKKKRSQAIEIALIFWRGSGFLSILESFLCFLGPVTGRIKLQVSSPGFNCEVEHLRFLISNSQVEKRDQLLLLRNFWVIKCCSQQVDSHR